jgi:hypothetical protein
MPHGSTPGHGGPGMDSMRFAAAKPAAQAIVKPPSITKFCPVVQAPALPAGNTAMPAISSGTPMRFNGAVADYLAHIGREARTRPAAGLSAEQAARDIRRGRYATWKDAKRIAVNVDALYRAFNNDPMPPDAIRLFGLMGQIDFDR